MLEGNIASYKVQLVDEVETQCALDLFIHGDERGQCCFWKGVKVIGRGARGHMLGVLWRGCVAVHVSPLHSCPASL